MVLNYILIYKQSIFGIVLCAKIFLHLRQYYVAVVTPITVNVSSHILPWSLVKII